MCEETKFVDSAMCGLIFPVREVIFLRLPSHFVTRYQHLIADFGCVMQSSHRYRSLTCCSSSAFSKTYNLRWTKLQYSSMHTKNSKYFNFGLGY